VSEGGRSAVDSGSHERECRPRRVGTKTHDKKKEKVLHSRDGDDGALLDGWEGDLKYMRAILILNGDLGGACGGEWSFESAEREYK
jgi:hypothetical protein